MEKGKDMKRNPGDGSDFKMIIVGLLALLVVVQGYNQYQIAMLSSTPALNGRLEAELADAQQAKPAEGVSPSAELEQTSSVIPTGVPAIYGSELGISYDDISASDPQLADATISKLAAYDMSIDLSGDELERYIAIGTSISCEYCCGAQSIIFENGQAACGCAHSYAMRGLAKYLLRNHANEFTDAQILEELGKWKVLFFPGIHEQKAAALQQQGIEVDYITLASNLYRGIESGAGSGSAMVGGC